MSSRFGKVKQHKTPYVMTRHHGGIVMQEMSKEIARQVLANHVIRNYAYNG